jgi:hypothetical protein
VIAQDLSQYFYSEKLPLDGVLTVGWIGRASNFPKGLSPVGGVEKLREVILSNQKADFCFGQTRGFHHCDLCDPYAGSEKDGEESFFHGTEVISLGDSRMRLGSCEILIPVSDRPESYLASPSLIYHYIRIHQYSPPVLFWDAVFSVSLDREFVAQDIVDLLVAARPSV